MYFWKCWRDTRGAFLSFLGVIVLVVAAHVFVAGDWFSWTSRNALGIPGAAWQQSVDVLLRLTALCMPLAGFAIGAMGIGTEFENRTASFLLTRPRSRAYFAWSSWVFGALEMAVLIGIAIFLFAVRKATPGNPAMTLQGALRAIGSVLIPALVIFSATFCFTLLLKKGQHGTNAAIAAIAAYSGLVLIVRLWYAVRIPVFWEFYTKAFDHSRDLPLASMSGWLAVAVLAPLIAWAHFRRAEV